MSARFPLSLRLFFTTCLCLCVCLAAGCSGKQVHVTVENEFNMMAKRLAPVLKAHASSDEHGAYVAPRVFDPGTAAPAWGISVPASFSGVPFQGRSGAAAADVRPVAYGGGYGGDAPYGFMLGQGRTS